MGIQWNTWDKYVTLWDFVYKMCASQNFVACLLAHDAQISSLTYVPLNKRQPSLLEQELESYGKQVNYWWWRPTCFCWPHRESDGTAKPDKEAGLMNGEPIVKMDVVTLDEKQQALVSQKAQSHERSYVSFETWCCWWCPLVHSCSSGRWAPSHHLTFWVIGQVSDCFLHTYNIIR